MTASTAHPESPALPDELLDERIEQALAQVEDPEVAITLRDLGVLREVRRRGPTVHVRMVPTRLACPGRDEMARRVRVAVGEVDPGLEVEIDWDLTSWSAEDITPHGCGVLRAEGYTAEDSAISCPYGEGEDVRRAAEFGGALCKIPYHCQGCGSTFDRLAGAALPVFVS